MRLVRGGVLPCIKVMKKEGENVFPFLVYIEYKGREVGKSRMAGIRRDGKWASLECSGTGKFPKFPGKNSVPQKQDRERRPLAI